MCAQGPGDQCGPYGKCGIHVHAGLICIQGCKEGLLKQELEDYPSFREVSQTSKLQ